MCFFFHPQTGMSKFPHFSESVNTAIIIASRNHRACGVVQIVLLDYAGIGDGESGCCCPRSGRWDLIYDDEIINQNVHENSKILLSHLKIIRKFKTKKMISIPRRNLLVTYWKIMNYVNLTGCINWFSV